ncbi:asparagine synthase-related protein [Actinomadura roseirufa]|uniref:asparagine synthase-related protein n=1 Tax=Actinomadura roseirufa TaxID=2094049 RepID=UPI0013F14E73|nr:asparagine synthase-related protein [Actinomadura roseirufa]
MRAYLALSTGGPTRIPPEVLARIREVAPRCVPVPAHDLRAEEWVSDDGATALLGWTNEPAHPLLPPLITEHAGRVLGHCGYLGDPGDDRRLLESTDLAGTAEGLGGCFSLFRAGPGGFEAVTSITRVCPVYHATSGGLHLAGSRALLVHLATNRTPVLDVPALQPMVRHGFFATDETPFAGVRALPNAASLTVEADGIVTIIERSFPEQAPPPRTAKEARALLARPAEALLAAVEPLRRHSDPVRLALSGGRDSRLLAAVLHAAGVPFHTRTHGFPDHPDPILAARVAGILGVEHRFEPTAPTAARDSIEVEHPLVRAHHVIRMCEGMTSAYESVDRHEPYTLAPRTSGSGGETLRGGFLYDQDDISPKALQRRVRSIFLSAEGFATPEANDRARLHHERWASEAGPDALDKLYLFYRTGRWIVGSHTATLMNSTYYHPFFDNRVVREMLTLPALWRHSEEPFHGLISLLAPKLRDVPTEGKRWRFERTGARRLSEFRARRNRAPLVPTGRTSSFNWRKSYDPGFLAILRDQVMNGPRELFDIVNETKAKEHFASVPTSWSNQIWHIYTLSVLLSNDWQSTPPDLPRVRIPLP